MWKSSMRLKTSHMDLMHMMVFIIAILVNSKQLRENEETNLGFDNLCAIFPSV